MRIAITLQSLRHLGGIGIYTQQIVNHLLTIDKKNEYVLIYPSFGQAHKSLGKFKQCENVTEILSKSLVPHGYYWDHLVVPKVAKKNGIDLLFNPFLSVPLLGSFKKVLIMHNSEWFTMPEVFWFTERVTGGLRMKAIMNAADKIISVSDAVTEDCIRATELPASKFRTIYHGVDDKFKVITDETILRTIKDKYHLPDKFLLFVGAIYPQKNFSMLIQAFSLMIQDIPHQLVVAGNTRWNYKDDLKLIKEKGLENRIQLLGWVNPEDIPALYNLADCFVYPSLYEGFGLCLVEAMACGCPGVAAATGALPEVAQDAAILVDPKSALAMKEAILKVISDTAVRQQLIQNGLTRAKDFTWKQCATETLQVFYELAEKDL
jgi:glycosyltransferase involved in cell wall biosynthesis